MGGYQSKPSESTPTKEFIDDQQNGKPDSTSKHEEQSGVDVITNISLSMCEVDKNGSGFLGRFMFSDIYYYGLFTNNHILSDEILANEEIVTISMGVIDQKIQLEMKNTFRFTCHLLDATFVQFNEDLVQRLEALKCHFLTIHSNWMGVNGGQVMVVQHYGGSDLQVAQGVFESFHGFDIFHRVLSDFGSAGSPVVLHDGRVVGMHKRMSTDRCNVAISMKNLLQAILKNVEHNGLPIKLVSNPRNLEKRYERQVFEQGLIRSKKVTKQNPFMYISPAIPLVATPIWFVPTSHGWYWTPTDPFKNDLDTNWMSVDRMKVIGGYWHGIEPADKNITIIKWLRRNNYP